MGAQINSAQTKAGKEDVMDENEILENSTEQTSEDAFLMGFGADATEVEADQPEEAAEQVNEEVEEPENPDEGQQEPDTTTEGTTEQDADQHTEPVEQPHVWNLKHLDENVTVTSDEEAVRLMQMGLDYKRIRDERDALKAQIAKNKPTMAVFENAAKAQNIEVGEYTRNVRKQILMDEGASESLADRILDIEDAQNAMPTEEVNEPDFEAQPQTAAPAEAKDRAKAEVAEFTKNYPGVKEIPDEVWAAVRGGKNMSVAYAEYRTAQAEAKLAEMEKQTRSAAKNSQNASRSTGSMGTVGAEKRSKDPFLDGFMKG